jgi:hypothetical protein
MDPFTMLAIGQTAANLGASIFGMSAEAKQASEMADAADKAYKFQEKEVARQNKYNLKTHRINKRNRRKEYDYQDATNQLNYQYNVKIREYQQNLAERQYQQSEKNYKKQLAFNNLAAARAYESENRRMQEIEIGDAFAKQDMLVKETEAVGQVAARGQAGRTPGKEMQSELAGIGRNLAIMEESMKSAYKQYNQNLQNISLQKYGADMNAEAARMLKPERLPEIPEPLAVPRAKVARPYKLKVGPKAFTPGYNPTADIFGAAADLAGGIGGAVKAYNKTRSNTKSNTQQDNQGN